MFLFAIEGCQSFEPVLSGTNTTVAHRRFEGDPQGFLETLQPAAPLLKAGAARKMPRSRHRFSSLLGPSISVSENRVPPNPLDDHQFPIKLAVLCICSEARKRMPHEKYEETPAPGDSVLYDSRLLHCGGANVSSSTRALLYVTFRDESLASN